MGSIFAYSITSSILLTAMYLIYKWMLAGENQHAYNRAIIWSIYLCALIAPFFIPSIAEWISEPTPTSANALVEIDTPIRAMEIVNEPSLLPRILLGIYIFGCLIALVFTITVVIKLWKTIHSGQRHNAGTYTIIVIPDTSIAPFSWLRYIVMSVDDYKSAYDVITAHEKRHLELNHWLDLLTAQIIAIFQWFNPTAWLMREELKTVHEYQADEAVIRSGANPKEYQMLLIKKAVGARFPSLANSLNHSKLKKRVTMMYKSKSSASRRLRALAIVPAGILAIMAINLPTVASAINKASEASIALPTTDKVTENAQDVQNLKLNGKVLKITGSAESTSTDKVGNEPIFVNGVKQDASFDLNSISSGDIESITVIKSGAERGIHITLKGAKTSNSSTSEVLNQAEKMPEFPGGTTELMNWLTQNIKYPESAVKEKLNGRVVVKFVVNKDGSIGETTVVRSIHPDLDKEAVRVVKAMPKWTPGTIDGKPVAVWYTIPIMFKTTSSTTK